MLRIGRGEVDVEFKHKPEKQTHETKIILNNADRDTLPHRIDKNNSEYTRSSSTSQHPFIEIRSV